MLSHLWNPFLSFISMEKQQFHEYLLTQSILHCGPVQKTRKLFFFKMYSFFIENFSNCPFQMSETVYFPYGKNIQGPLDKWAKQFNEIQYFLWKIFSYLLMSSSVSRTLRYFIFFRETEFFIYSYVLRM